MDNVYVRTAADLEKKYNLSKYAKNIANIETMNGQIIHLNKELEDTKKAIIINLGDTLQSSVSLYFYEGVPTTLNEPYIDWVTPSDHIDDLYYDQLTGYVYKYTQSGWERQYDTNLINALALTNAELDVSQDHERKVYLTQPTPPYSSGDWWIQEDGTLYICQLGKPSGSFENNDFIVSSKYTSTIASKENDTIRVIQGQVVEIIDNASYISQRVTETQTIVDENGAEINTLKNQVTTLETSTNYQINTINTRMDNGVPKVLNGLVLIDGNGINTSRADETFNTQITNKTFEVKDGTTPMAFIGYKQDEQRMVAQIPELEAKQATIGVHRTEVIEKNNKKRTAGFYVGGGN